MQITVTQRYTRQSPRKVRLVANQVRKLPLSQAIEQLGLIEKKSTLVILKTLRQALANAQHNHGLKFEDLRLENILVTEGPRYRRFNAVSRGRAHGIVKRTCHVQVILNSAAAPTKKAPVIDSKPVEPTQSEVAEQPKKAVDTKAAEAVKASTRAKQTAAKAAPKMNKAATTTKKPAGSK